MRSVHVTFGKSEGPRTDSEIRCWHRLFLALQRVERRILLALAEKGVSYASYTHEHDHN